MHVNCHQNPRRSVWLSRRRFPAGARGGCGRRGCARDAQRATAERAGERGAGRAASLPVGTAARRACRARCRRARPQRARAAAALAPLAAAVLGRRRRHHLRRCRCNRRRPGVARAPRRPSRRVSNLSTSERGASAAMCGARATSVAASAARSTRAASSCGTRRCCSPGTSPSAHAAQWPACACASSVAAPHCLHLPRRSQALPRSSQQTATTRPCCRARRDRRGDRAAALDASRLAAMRATELDWFACETDAAVARAADTAGCDVVLAADCNYCTSRARRQSVACRRSHACGWAHSDAAPPPASSQSPPPSTLSRPLSMPACGRAAWCSSRAERAASRSMTSCGRLRRAATCMPRPWRCCSHTRASTARRRLRTRFGSSGGQHERAHSQTDL